MPDLPLYDYDLFLSHNHADQEWTARLAERLEQEDWQERKLKVFFSPWDIRPGQSIPEEIEKALSKSRKVGLVMSPDAIGSAWVELERLVTVYVSVSARDKRLIPLYRRDCEIPPLLKPILYIDFRDDDLFEENYQVLLHAIKDAQIPRRSRTVAPSSARLLPVIPRPPVVGFVARRDADGCDIIERLKEELAPQRNQLVALSGSGGVGKTTLAEEALRVLSASFQQRVVLTSALGRDDYSFSTLLDEIVTQLGHPELRAQPTDQKAEQVQVLVASAPTLIILDNFETIKPEEQARCFGFLRHRVNCPALITGRERIDGALNIEIPVMSPAEAGEFLDRLIGQTGDRSAFAQVDRDRVITAAERTPLVMEWIVGQIDLAMDPDTVLNELAHGGGDAAQWVFDRSFGLEQLGDDGRATLLALSLFAPDASRAGLVEVAGFDNDTNRLNEAVKRLARLHLLKPVAGLRLTVAGLTRELAKARMSKDDHTDDYRRRFVAYFVSYVEAHEQPTAEDYYALEIEKDNLTNSMDVSSDVSDSTSIIRIGFPLTKFLALRGYWDEDVRRSKQALAAAQASNHEYHVGAFANHLGSMFASQGDYPSAKAHYELAVEIAKRLEAKQGLAATLNQLAVLAQDQGDPEEARRLHYESLAIKQTLGDQRGIAISLHNLAIVAQNQGKLGEARRLYHESLEIEKSLMNESGIASSLHALATLAQDQGEFEEARQLYRESLESKKKLGNQSGIASTLHELGRLAQNQGEFEEAQQLYNQSMEIEQKLGSQSGIASTLHELGRLAQNQGKLEEARRLYNQSIEIDQKLGHQRGNASSLHNLAALAHAQGELGKARRLYHESLGIKKKLGNQSSTAITLHELGRLAEDDGNKIEAARLFREALEVFEKLGSPYAEIARESLVRIEGKSS